MTAVFPTDQFLAAEELQTNLLSSAGDSETPDPIGNYSTEKRTLERKEEKLFENTFFSRINPKDLDPSSPHKKGDFVFGIIDGKLKGRVETSHLRRVPFAKFQRLLGILAFAGASLSFYLWTSGKQGIVVKELTKAAAALSVGEMNKFPLALRIAMPLATSLGLYFLKEATNDNLPAQFAFIGSTAVCAILARRLGKGFSKGSYAGNPNCVGSCNTNHCNGDFQQLDETNTPDGDLLTTIPVTPIEEEQASFSTDVNIHVTKKNGHMYHQLQIGKKFFDAVRIGEDDDDDDDDDDDAPVKNAPSTGRKLTVLAVAAGATALSTYFLGEGITTSALTTLFSAPAKADLRMMPWGNGYGLLGLAAGSLMTIQSLAPKALIGELSFIPITIAASKALKELKDCNTGKRPKNRYWFEVPVFIKRFFHKTFYWAPPLPKFPYSPFESVLDKKNEKRFTVSIPATHFDEANSSEETIDVEFKVKGGALKAKYKIPKEKKKEIKGLVKVKAKKPSKVREGAFLGSFGLGSLASSYLTQSQSPDQVQGFRVNTESQGEGVLTNLLNGTLTSTAKQMGKKIPPKVLIACLVTTTAIANSAELALLYMGKLPLHFAGIINAIGLGVVSKISKNWIYGKKYFKAKKVKTPVAV